eukprot:COSAG04_NODE_2164_length_4647_cov_2.916667_1_plen_27_part_10
MPGREEGLLLREAKALSQLLEALLHRS